MLIIFKCHYPPKLIRKLELNFPFNHMIKHKHNFLDKISWWSWSLIITLKRISSSKIKETIWTWQLKLRIIKCSLKYSIKIPVKYSCLKTYKMETTVREKQIMINNSWLLIAKLFEMFRETKGWPLSKGPTQICKQVVSIKLRYILHLQFSSIFNQIEVPKKQWLIQ